MKTLCITSIWLAALLLSGCDRSTRAFQGAKETDKIGTYQQFLQNYPTSKHADAARTRIHALEWQTVRESGKSAEVRSFLNENPKSPHAAEAKLERERLVWNEISWSQDIDTLRGFLKEFPEGANAGIAEKAMLKLQWTKLSSDPSIEELTSFISENADSAYSQDAGNLLQWTKLAADPSIQALTSYIDENPDTAYSKEARQLLQKLEMEEDFGGFKDKLKAFLNGDEDRNKIAELNGREFKPKGPSGSQSGVIIDPGSVGQVGREGDAFWYELIFAEGNRVGEILEYHFRDGVMITFTNGHCYKRESQSWVRQSP